MRSRLGWVGRIGSRQPCAGGARWDGWRALGAGRWALGAGDKGAGGGASAWAVAHVQPSPSAVVNVVVVVSGPGQCCCKVAVGDSYRCDSARGISQARSHGCRSRWEDERRDEARHNPTAGRLHRSTADNSRQQALSVLVVRSFTGGLAGWLAG